MSTDTQEKGSPYPSKKQMVEFMKTSPKDAYNQAIDDAISVVGNYYSGEGTITKSATDAIIRQLQQLQQLQQLKK